MSKDYKPPVENHRWMTLKGTVEKPEGCICVYHQSIWGTGSQTSVMRFDECEAHVKVSMTILNGTVLNEVRKAHLKIARERPESLSKAMIDELGTVRPDESIEGRTERYSDYLDRRQAIIKQHFPDKD